VLALKSDVFAVSQRVAQRDWTGLKKRLSPGDFPRHPKTVGPDNKKTVSKHATPNAHRF